VRKAHAADDRSLHVFVFGAFRPLGLATTTNRATGTAEGTRSATALTGPTATTATGTTGTPGASATGTAAETSTRSCGTACAAATGTTGAVVTATATGASALAGTGPRAAGSTGTAGTRGARTRRARTHGAAGTRRHIARGCPTGPGPTWTRRHTAGCRPGTRRGAGCRAGHRTLDRLRRRERVIAHPGLARERRFGRRRARAWAGFGNWTHRSRRDLDRCGRGLRCDRGDRGGRCRRNRLRNRRGCGGGGRLGRCGFLCRRRLGGGLCAAERLPETARDRRLDRRGRRFDELALLAQPSENFLAGNTEFFSQLVYAGLACHYFSISRGVSGG
jgi:hypothetical protein